MPTATQIQEKKIQSAKSETRSFNMTLRADTYNALIRKANRQSEKYSRNVTVQDVLRGIAELATSTGEFANLESEPKT